MRYLLLPMILLAVACHTVNPIAANLSTPSDPFPDLSSAQWDTLQQSMRYLPEESQLALALVEGPEVTFLGLKRLRGQIKVVENQAKVFEIGSITKVFTTHLLWELVQEGKLPGLEEEIASYLNFQLKGNPRITFAQLANHTAGLPMELSTSVFRMANPYRGFDKSKIKNILTQKLSLLHHPGEAYAYSNLGMGLLGCLLENLEETSYEEMLQLRILRPLGMSSTGTERERFHDVLVKGRSRKGKPTAYWDLSALQSAGGMLSSVADLAKYAQWCLKEFNADFQIMQRPTVEVEAGMAVSLGWHIISKNGTSPFLWHNGGTGGFKSSLALDPSRQKAVIVLSNVGGSRNPRAKYIDRLCFALMQLEDK